MAAMAALAASALFGSTLSGVPPKRIFPTGSTRIVKQKITNQLLAPINNQSKLLIDQPRALY